MHDVPENLLYSKDHEWVEIDGDIGTIGISDHAQAELSDVVFVDLPEVGATVAAGDPVAVVESVKAASDVYTPVSGEILEVNEELSNDPSLINSDPYGAGWLYKIRLDVPTETEDMMNATDYEEYCSGIRPDGVFFSGQTFIAKITAAIATVINGIAYSVVGFSDAKVQEVNDYIAAGGIPRLNPEYQPFMTVLFFIVSVPPVIGCILSVLPTIKYALSDKEHKRILDELNERRHAAEN